MARRVNPEEYAARRAQILAAVFELIQDKGYQEMTISDVLTALGISKGAFYHYFDSKRALLDGIVEMMTADAFGVIQGVVSDPSLDAVTKLRTYLASAVAWKAAHDMELAAIARIWRHENNTVLKQRISDVSVRTLAPLIAVIIRQGRAEGVFDATYPEEAATIIAGMGLHLGDALIDAFTGPVDSSSEDRREVLVQAYLEALERILGATPRSLTSLTTQIAGAVTFTGRPGSREAG
ncbi:MAG: Transcriptional regulator, TetR family [Nonomuraea muscovyensis]|jgi:AcrR family transcriptional regulator|nr:Transcriptional regulator, TetR family [Nonomuraea muscovyensis]